MTPATCEEDVPDAMADVEAVTVFASFSLMIVKIIYRRK